MTKSNSGLMFALGIVVVLIAIVAVVFFLYQRNTPIVSVTNTSDMPMTNTNTNPTPSSFPVNNNIVTIQISNMQFPSETHIKKGQTVRWVNNDSTPHTVTFKDISVDSGTLSPGASFENKFDTAGTFNYGCNFHSFMQGKIVVE